jgi:DNA invertase Pin-like site-specific DNA recombinase
MVLVPPYLSVDADQLSGIAAMTIRAYVRVSTADERCELQVRELQEYAERQGWQIADIYEDVSSGAKASRPALNRLIADARARKFDCLLVWKLDRFGRSLVDCLNNIKILEENGIRFIAVTQGLDTDLQNPASWFLLHVLGTAAEFERALIRERTQAGRARYKQDFASGKVGRTVQTPGDIGLSVREPARERASTFWWSGSWPLFTTSRFSLREERKPFDRMWKTNRDDVAGPVTRLPFGADAAVGK